MDAQSSDPTKGVTPQKEWTHKRSDPTKRSYCVSFWTLHPGTAVELWLQSETSWPIRLVDIYTLSLWCPSFMLQKSLLAGQLTNLNTLKPIRGLDILAKLRQRMGTRQSMPQFNANYQISGNQLIAQGKISWWSCSNSAVGHPLYFRYFIADGIEFDKARWLCLWNSDQNCTQNSVSGPPPLACLVSMLLIVQDFESKWCEWEQGFLTVW